jgi:hypothetical protein
MATKKRLAGLDEKLARFVELMEDTEALTFTGKTEVEARRFLKAARIMRDRRRPFLEGVRPSQRITDKQIYYILSLEEQTGFTFTGTEKLSVKGFIESATKRIAVNKLVSAKVKKNA